MSNRIRNSDQFTHVVHEDITKDGIEARQRAISHHSRLAGLRFPNKRASSKYLCQKAAARLRAREESRTLEQLRKHYEEGNMLFAVTLVFPDEQGCNERKVLGEKRASRLQHYLEQVMAREPEIGMIAGCLEVDRCHKGTEEFWQHTAHLSVAVSAVRKSTALKILKRAFALKPSAHVKRPVVIKRIFDARNWVRYCYKSLSYGSTVRRCTYDKKPGSNSAQQSTRNVRLLPAERDALIRHLAKHGYERQLIRIERE